MPFDPEALLVGLIVFFIIIMIWKKENFVKYENPPKSREKVLEEEVARLHKVNAELAIKAKRSEFR